MGPPGPRRVKFDDPWTRPVLVWLTVGVPSWAMPEVAILDGLGLNDRVHAR